MGEPRSLRSSSEVERAVSDMLAERALADEKGNEDLLGAVVNIGDKLVTVMNRTTDKVVGATVDTAKTLGTGLRDLWGEIRDLGEAVDEKLDSVVGFIVEPIKKGLSAVAKELTSGIDDRAMQVGFVVGAVVGLKDEIWNGFKWLYENWEVVLQEGWDLYTGLLETQWELLKTIAPHVLEGLQKLGDVILSGLDAGWEFFKAEVVPEIVSGLSDIGHWVWDMVPDWLQSGLSAVHDVVTFMGSLGADISGYLLDGLKEVLEFFGFDTLAGTVDYLSDVLHGLAEWLGVTTEGETAAATRGLGAAGAEASRARTLGEITAAGGPAEEIYSQATQLGATFGQAAHFASLADTNLAATEIAMQAFRSSIESGMERDKAYSVAFRAFKEAAGGRVATVPTGGGAGAGGALESMAAERALESDTARKTQKSMEAMVEMQRQVVAEQRRGKTGAPEGIDSFGGPDELSLTAYNAGRGGGGQS